MRVISILTILMCLSPGISFGQEKKTGEQKVRKDQQRVLQRTQQLKQIRSSGGEYGIDGVSDQTFQEASLHPMITLQMTLVFRGRVKTPRVH